MRIKKTLLFFLIIFTQHLCNGQINPLDSCGLNSNPILNQYEIKILDSLFFSSYLIKKSKATDPNSRFDFRNKKIGFYSCTKNSNTNGNGLLSKKEFFDLCRPNFKGHAGRGIIAFNEKEKIESKGFDAVIIIDCPYAPIKKDLILKLVNRNNSKPVYNMNL
jgi:hypothetical protein